MLLTDLLRQAPAGSAVAFAGERVTYPDLLRRVERRAAGLREWGVRAGDRVALHMGNRLEWLELWFATAWLDADLVPVDTDRTDAEVRHVLGDSGARWLVWEPATPAEHPARVHLLVRGLDVRLAQGMPYAGDPPAVAETERAATVSYAPAFPAATVVRNADLVRAGRDLGLARQVTGDDVVTVADPLSRRGATAFLAALTHGAPVVLVPPEDVL